jgi:hypothetical protein
MTQAARAFGGRVGRFRRLLTRFNFPARRNDLDPARKKTRPAGKHFNPRGEKTFPASKNFDLQGEKSKSPGKYSSASCIWCGTRLTMWGWKQRKEVAG